MVTSMIKLQVGVQNIKFKVIKIMIFTFFICSFPKKTIIKAITIGGCSKLHHT